MSAQKINKEKSNSTQTPVEILSAKDLGLNRNDVTVVSPRSFAVSIRALLQNWRQGTVGCKDRSEVSYSNKKPWKQKGTGRARAGSKRSPLWRGGGVIFGPQPRVRKLKVNKVLRKNILNNLFLNLLENKNVLSLNYQVSERPKTSEVFKILKSLNLDMKKIVLLVDPSDILTQSAFSNIPNVRILFFDELNSFDLTYGNVILSLKKDLNTLKESVLRWT